MKPVTLADIGIIEESNIRSLNGAFYSMLSDSEKERLKKGIDSIFNNQEEPANLNHLIGHNHD